MTEPQAKQYAWLDTTLQSLVAEARERGDLGLISVWLQNVLARPNSGFRLEGVSRQLGKVHVPLQALQPDPDDPSGPRQLQNILLEPVVRDAELLPKEAWLASYCQAEAAQGRKVLVYVRQTATRDIQPRLVETLARAGLRTISLPDSVEAVRREAWIAQRAGGYRRPAHQPQEGGDGPRSDRLRHCGVLRDRILALHPLAGDAPGVAPGPNPSCQGGVRHLPQHDGGSRPGPDGPEAQSRAAPLRRQRGSRPSPMKLPRMTATSWRSWRRVCWLART